MEIHEFFLKRWEVEQGGFAKVLRAMPEGQLAWRPHERSKSAGELAWQLVLEQRQLVEMIEKGETRWEPSPHPDTVGAIVEAWETATAELRAALSRVDAARAAKPARLLLGGDQAWSDRLDNMLWGYLFDMVHHRGQLSTYLRPMGGKVPAIYGPSADSQS